MSEETVTFKEFKAFITGMIKGKRGVLPNVEDWKEIKMMMDRVVPDVKEVVKPSLNDWNNPSTQPNMQWPYNVPPFPTPSYPHNIWYSGDTVTGTGLTLKNHDHTFASTITIDDIDSDAFFETGFSQDPAFQITGYAKK